MLLVANLLLLLLLGLDAVAAAVLPDGNWIEKRLERVVAGLLPGSKPCGLLGGANDQAMLDAVEAHLATYGLEPRGSDPRLQSRAVARVVGACGGLPEGTPQPQMHSDAGLAEAAARIARAASDAFDADIAAAWPGECARIDTTAAGFSWDGFYQAHLLRGVPAVLEGLGEDQLGQGVARWRNASYLRERFGDSEHDVSLFGSQLRQDRLGYMPMRVPDAGWGEEQGGGGGLTRFPGEHTVLRLPYKREAVTLSEMLSSGFGGRDRSWFSEQSPLYGELDKHGRDAGAPASPMGAELKTPEFALQWCQKESANANFWVGRVDPRGVHASKNSGMHFDSRPGFLHQIAGRKTWTLFHVLDSPNVYPSWLRRVIAEPPDAGFRNSDWEEDMGAYRKMLAGETGEQNGVRDLNSIFSPINPHAPDLVRHPNFARARPMTCRVGPGDTIFVPGNTWHDVNSTHAPREGAVNSGVNYWLTCQTNEHDHLAEIFLDTLRLREWKETYGAYPPLQKNLVAAYPELAGSSSGGEQQQQQGEEGGEGDNERTGADDEDEL